MFSVGDNIKKNKSDTIYTIIELKEDNGGNWHDGYYECLIATLESNKITEEYMIMFHQYGNNPLYYAILIPPQQLSQ